MNKETNYPLQTYIRQISVQIPVGVTLTAEQYQQLAQNSNKSLEAAKVFIALVPMLIVYPVPAEILCNRYYTGSSKRIMKYTKRGFLKRNRKPLFCAFLRWKTGVVSAGFSCVRGENSVR